MFMMFDLFDFRKYALKGHPAYSPGLYAFGITGFFVLAEVEFSVY